MEINKEDSIEVFIRNNRKEFDIQGPSGKHAEKFMERLNRELRHLVSIVPYLARVAVVTFLVFIFSVIVWNNYIRKDRHEITLKEKVILVIHSLSRTIAK
ncbi:MAG TPA: hypothetical protein VMT63_12730 [Bacteroidales bacterium]|nr:hypothetical protein [Bacteroidales bacterium]